MKTEMLLTTTDIEWLKQLLTQQLALNQQQAQTIATLEKQLGQLQHRLDEVLTILYGKKSERYSKPTQSPASQQNIVETAAPIEDKKSATTSGHGRRRLPVHLERKRVCYDLASSEKVCQCGCKLNRMGSDITEQLEFIPAQLIVIEHERFKYSCHYCKATVKVATLPEQPIAKGLAGPGLLSEILVNKYLEHMPLYRQEQRWQRLGYALSRSTLCDWVAQCAILLSPLVEHWHQHYLLKSCRVHVDDTTLKVQALEKTHLGRIWVLIGGGEGVNPLCTVYRYSKHRNKDSIAALLKDYRGYLQADAYAGYDHLYQNNRIIEVACLAHARRKFMDIVKSLQSKSKIAHAKPEIIKVKSRADDALVLMGKLYGIEDVLQHRSVLFKYYYRKRHAKPILKILYRWLQATQQQTLADTPIGKAIQYMLNHWRALCHYLCAGYLDIDNNRAERAMKPIALGRKNYLFAGTHDSAQQAAIIYSVIETCKQHQVNASEYLKDILQKLPSQKITQLDELMPWRWKKLVATAG